MTLQLTGADWHGSTMLSRTSGANTTQAWSPFGGGTHRTGVAASLPGFNGERQDPLSGVTHLGNGYRAYSPALRRFTCPDSESPFGIGGINPYAYCESDPINKTDPSGHGPITWLIRKIIGLSVRAGIKAAMSEGASASLATAGTVETGIELATSAVTGQASRAVAKTNPHAAKVLGWMSLGIGIAGTLGVAEKLVPQIGRRIKGLSGKIARTTVTPLGRPIKFGGPIRNSMTLTGKHNFIQCFEDTYKNGRRLNIAGHGEYNASYGSAFMCRGDIEIDPLDLIRELRKHRINIREYDSIRLIMCHSADGGVDSFAAELSRRTKKIVKGFHGYVDACAATLPDTVTLSNELGILREGSEFIVMKTNTYDRTTQFKFWAGFNYAPEVFKPA